MLKLQIDVAHLNYAVADAVLDTPDGGKLKAKLLTLVDAESGVTVECILPAEAPPGVQGLPADFVPPAQDLGGRLLDKKVHVEVARTMPSGMPPRR